MHRNRRGGRRWLGVWLAVHALALAGFAQNDEFDPLETRRDEPARRRIPISMDGGASINPKVLADVEDNTLGLTGDDREAYFRILKLTEKLGSDELRILAREFREDRHAASKYRKRSVAKFPIFADLFRHPDEYRGRPVALHGYLRRLVTYSAGKNDQGLTDLYEGWLYPDGGQGNPAVIIFTEKPKGLPIGGDITEEVSVAGYFLKMYGYQAQDTTRKAPLILANTVRWRPQEAAAPWTPSPQLYAALTVGMLVIGAIIAIGVRESRLRYELEKRNRRAQYDEFVPPDDGAAPKPMTHSFNGSATEPHH